MDKVPFSVYDFFAYLSSGSILLATFDYILGFGPFKSASIKGSIKKLKASYVAPTELTFTVAGEARTFTLEQVLEMKEEEWFSRGVALSDPCNISIVDNSLEKLEQLRLSGTKHQIIAVGCSINHGQRIRSLYEERGYRARHFRIPGVSVLPALSSSL